MLRYLFLYFSFLFLVRIAIMGVFIAAEMTIYRLGVSFNILFKVGRIHWQINRIYSNTWKLIADIAWNLFDLERCAVSEFYAIAWQRLWPDVFNGWNLNLFQGSLVFRTILKLIFLELLYTFLKVFFVDQEIGELVSLLSL